MEEEKKFSVDKSYLMRKIYIYKERGGRERETKRQSEERERAFTRGPYTFSLIQEWKDDVKSRLTAIGEGVEEVREKMARREREREREREKEREREAKGQKNGQVKVR